jgi:hypothetical protein
MKGLLKNWEPLFAWPNVMALLASRVLFAAICAIEACLGPVPAWSLGCYVCANALFALRSGYLLDGADRLFLVTAAACFIAQLSSTDTGAAIGLFFLAGQLSIIYFTNGVVKLAEPGWRSGEALMRTFSTRMFGRRSLHRFLAQRRSVARLLAQAVICGEIAASLAPWAPLKVAIVLLLGAAAFHCVAAAVMGLNTFLFAFPALFPAALYMSRTIYGP